MLNIKKMNLKKIIAINLVGLSAFSLAAWVTAAHASAHLAGGDFMQAFNNTTQEGTWRDPITAKSGEIVEFRVVARNDGDQPAEDVQVWGSLNGQVPQDPSSQLVVTARIRTASFGGNEQTDSATVNVTGNPEGLRYVTGHARLNGVTDKFNCPNTCDISDDVMGGINIGTIQPGDFVEVTFKAGLTNTPVETPTPTPTETVTPTPTVTVTPTPTSVPVTPTPTTAAGGTNVVNETVVNNNNTNNNTQTQSQTNNQTVNVTTSAPIVPIVERKEAVVASVKQLPKTGLPVAAWALSGLLPIGAGLRRFGGKKENNEENPNYLAQKRSFLKGE